MEQPNEGAREGGVMRREVREEKGGRGREECAGSPSPVMTEQQPHHDGAPVPMTTQPVRWRGERERERGGGMHARTGEMEGKMGRK